jgi:hypothetical protein
MAAAIRRARNTPRVGMPGDEQALGTAMVLDHLTGTSGGRARPISGSSNTMAASRTATPFPASRDGLKGCPTGATIHIRRLDRRRAPGPVAHAPRPRYPRPALADAMRACRWWYQECR